MNRIDLYNSFSEIDDDILERSETAAQGQRKRPWLRYGAIAACFCLLMAAAATVPEMLPEVTPVPSEIIAPSVQPGPEQHESVNKTEGPYIPLLVHFNEITPDLAASRIYIPGYFTEVLSEEKLNAVKPGMWHEWMQYSGYAGFNGEGGLVAVYLTVTTTLPENSIAVAISDSGSTRDYIFSGDAVISVCEEVKYKVYQWESGENSVILAADASINDVAYSFTLRTTQQNLDRAKEDFTQVLECFAHYAEGKPNLDAITANEIPEWFDNTLTHTEALAEPSYGAYMLSNVPSGFSEESIRRYKDQNSDYLSGLWTSGYDEISWKVSTISQEDEIRLTSVADTKNYDLSLYPIPRAESVPDELREIVDNPIFPAEELTIDAVWARAYKSGETGDSEGWRMAFSVKYEDVLVEVRTKGVDPEWVYQQLADLIVSPEP